MEAYLPNLLDMAVLAQIAVGSCQRAAHKQSITSAYQQKIIVSTCGMLALPRLAVCVCERPICTFAYLYRVLNSKQTMRLYFLSSGDWFSACRSPRKQLQRFENNKGTAWHLQYASYSLSMKGCKSFVFDEQHAPYVRAPLLHVGDGNVWPTAS
jgi:hypothetical protein